MPDLGKGYTPWKASGWVNAQGIFAWGLVHDQGHRAQIEKILRQIDGGFIVARQDLVSAGQMF